MTKAHYYTCTTSKNDTGYDSYSVPFCSSFKSKDINQAIKQFYLDFPKSLMKWHMATNYLDEKVYQARKEQIKTILKGNQ